MLKVWVSIIKASKIIHVFSENYMNLRKQKLLLILQTWSTDFIRKSFIIRQKQHGSCIQTRVRNQLR